MSRPTPGELARLACLLEATARKPGNVHRLADFEDTHYLDFVLSASAIEGALDLAASEGIGAAVQAAVEATARVVRTNTNLGMILLLAPMAAVPEGESLREGLARVLAGTTVEDARLVYRAIRLARPGGLGEVADQDVAEEPTVTLADAMRLAADRDLVARQYADGYTEVFLPTLAAMADSLRAGRPLESAIVRAHLTLMARHPDTLIARKRGRAVAEESARRAAAVLAAGWPDRPGSAEALAEFDAWLRGDGHARNPGTTADLVCAAIFAALREGLIPLPLDPSLGLALRGGGLGG